MNHPLTIYSASAGSGKTFTLAVEYITLLIANGKPDYFTHILAVTFTNKATAEMKDRILGQLYGIAHQLPQSSDYMEKVKQKLLEDHHLSLSDEEIRRRANEALLAMLHDFHHFRVETIDSFFQSILRNLAHELGLSATIEVDLRTDELIERAVERLIDSLCDEQGEIRKWIRDYIGDQLEEKSNWNFKQDLIGLAKCIFSEEYQRRTESDRQTLNDTQAVATFRNAMKKIRSSAKQEMHDMAQKVIDAVDKMSLNYNTIYRGSSWRKFAENIRELNDVNLLSTIQKGFDDANTLIKGADKKKFSPDEAQVVADLHQNLYEEYLKGIEHYNTACLVLQHINALRLLGAIENLCTAIATENNQFTLSKTPALLSRMIQDDDTPFVYERAGINFNHIMIDEFQDTSRMQWENFHKLLRENESKGGTDLIVGDIKQSIYRWRGGDAGILMGLKGHHVPLNTNFRSLRNVVQFNNDFFKFLAPYLDTLNTSPDSTIRIAELYEDVEQKVCKKDDGFVSIHLYDKSVNAEDYQQAEAADILQQIKVLRAQGLPYSKMAILVRKHDIGEALIRRFREMNSDVELVSDEAFLLSSSPAVQMIIAALRCLVDTNSSKLNLRYLALMYTTHVLGKTLSPDQVFLDNYDQVLPEALLPQNSRALLSEPLVLLCEHIYRILQLDKIEGQTAYMMTFMDEVQHFAQSAPPDVTSFLREWDEHLFKVAIPSNQIDGIRIVTIHKSKGLEYHTVFIPSINESVESDAHSQQIWCKAAEDEFNALGELPIEVNKKMKLSAYKDHYEAEHLQRRIDAINMMYVAFTRAGSNLMMWCKYSDGDSIRMSNLLHKFVEDKSFTQPHEGEMLWTMGEAPTAAWKAESASDNRLMPDMDKVEQTFITGKPQMTFLSSNASRRFVQQLSHTGNNPQQEAWEVGIIVHRMLCMMRTDKDLNKAIEACQRDGLIADKKMEQRIIEQIGNGLQREEVKRWFRPGLELFNENAIAALSPESGRPIVRRPDRVVMSDDHIYVIDYKLGRPQAEHQCQVQEYMDLIRRMYPNKQVEGALWYILRNEIVKVD